MLNRSLLLTLLMGCLAFIGRAQAPYITTIAGTDSAGYCCDNGPATNAALKSPEFICFDKHDNLYIVDGGNNRIRKVDHATNIITTIAGNGVGVGYSGDGGPATNASLHIPDGIAVDSADNIYFSDALNYRIRKVDGATGIISTVCGTGVTGYSGDGGPGTNAAISVCAGMCLDKDQNIYFCDYQNERIRRIDARSGIVTTYAGCGVAGYSGDGGRAIFAKFHGPIDPFMDGTGNLYVCDQYNHAIRKIAYRSGIITTVAGTGYAGYSGDGSWAKNAFLNQPGGLCVDKDHNIYIAEYVNGVIRRVDAASSIITTIAGTGIRGFAGDGGPANLAKLQCSDVKMDSEGNIYIADIDNSRIRKLYNPKLGTNALTSAIESPLLYPNPASEQITIENAQGKYMRVYTMTGQEVLSLRLKTDKAVVSVDGLCPGIYVVEFRSENGAIDRLKFVKE